MRLNRFFTLCMLATAVTMPLPAYATTVVHTNQEQDMLRECPLKEVDQVISAFALVKGECAPDYIPLGSVTWHKYFEVAFIKRGNKKVEVQQRPTDTPVLIAGQGVRQKVCSTKDKFSKEITSKFWIIESGDSESCRSIPRKAWLFRFKDRPNGDPELLEVGMIADGYRVKLSQLTEVGRANVMWVIEHAILPGLRSRKQRLVLNY